MSNATIGLPDELEAYLARVGMREPEILARLRKETATHPRHQMQIAPEQGALMAMLARLMGARRYIEIGTFTGYSSLAVGLALPPDGRIVCCDVSEEYTSVARRYWADAGLEDRVDLRIGPALETLARLLDEGAADSFDLAFIDAAKDEYPDYYEGLLRLVRVGGLIAIDNVFMGGDVAGTTDAGRGVEAVRALNARIATDERVSIAMIPIADGLTLARRER